MQLKEESCEGVSLKKEENVNVRAGVDVEAEVVEGVEVEKVILTGRLSTLTNIDTRRYDDDINAEDLVEGGESEVGEGGEEDDDDGKEVTG